VEFLRVDGLREHRGICSARIFFIWGRAAALPYLYLVEMAVLRRPKFIRSKNISDHPINEHRLPINRHQLPIN
jgi:hypothetical protein